MEMKRDLYPLPEVVERLGVNRTTVYGLIKSGDIQAVKIGRRTLVPAASIERYVARLTASDNADA